MRHDKYDEILNTFKQYYPTIYAQASDWWVSGRLAIIVQLKDGSLIEYDYVANTIRRLHTDERKTDDSVLRKEFGVNLEKMLVFTGLSKGELASKLGITNAMLTRYLKGKSMPSIDRAYKMTDVIGCTLNDLFDPDYTK